MLYGSISHVLTFSQGMVLCPRVHLRKTVSHRQSRLRGEDAFGLAERWRQQELVRNTWIRDVVGVLIERTEAPSSPALDDAMDIDDKSLGENNRYQCPHGLLNIVPESTAASTPQAMQNGTYFHGLSRQFKSCLDLRDEVPSCGYCIPTIDI